MDVAAKKRRLDRELATDGGTGAYDEDPDVVWDTVWRGSVRTVLTCSCVQANAMLLSAQNRALATNLFSYKRKIQSIQEECSAKTERLQHAERLLAVLSGKLLQVWLLTLPGSALETVVTV
jgi:hypothetical protein